MKVELGTVLKVSRGPHVEKRERQKENLKNPNITEAYVISYEDIKDYMYNENTTLSEDTKLKRKVYLDIKKTHKKSQVRSNDIIINQQSIFNRPRLVVFNESLEENKFIYDNSAVYIRPISPDFSSQIEMKFIYHLLDSIKVRNYLNEIDSKDGKRKITCDRISKILIDLPSKSEQQRIVRELEYIKGNLENLIELK